MQKPYKIGQNSPLKISTENFTDNTDRSEILIDILKREIFSMYFRDTYNQKKIVVHILYILQKNIMTFNVVMYLNVEL